MQRDTPETRVSSSVNEPALSAIEILHLLTQQSSSDDKEQLINYFNDINNCKAILEDPKFSLELIQTICACFDLPRHYYFAFDRGFELKNILDETHDGNIANALENALLMAEDVNLILKNEELLSQKYEEFKQGLFSQLTADLCLLLINSKREAALSRPEINEFYIQLLDVFSNVINRLIEILQNKALEDKFDSEKNQKPITREYPDNVKVTYSQTIEKHLKEAIQDYPLDIPKLDCDSPSEKIRIKREMDEWGKMPSQSWEKEKETTKIPSYRQSQSFFPEKGKLPQRAVSTDSFEEEEDFFQSMGRLSLQHPDSEREKDIDVTTLSEEDQMKLAIENSLKDMEENASPSLRRR